MPDRRSDPRRPDSSRAGSSFGGSGKRPPRSASRRKRERRREAIRAISQPRRRSRAAWYVALGGGAVAVVLVVLLVVVLTRGSSGGNHPTSSASASASPSAPVLASADNGATGQVIDGIQCQTMEQVAYHIHAHLAIYVNGTQRTIPEGIGIPPPRQEVQSDAGPFVESGKCFYWLHTHTADGIVHIESPTQKLYTLGNFFDIWQQTLTATQVGPDSGALTIYVNGKHYTGDPRAITLTAHEVIQIDVGTDVAPQPFTFPAGY